MSPLSLLRCLSLFLLLAWGACAQALPKLQRAVFEDTGGTLRIDQVVEREFTPFRGVLTSGYSASAWWVRLEVPPLPDGDWVLRVRPAYLDHVEAYVHDGDGWLRGDIGDHEPLASRSLPSHFPNLRLPSSPLPRTLYLRVVTDSTVTVHADLLPEPAFRASELRQTLLLGLYFALMLLVLLWVLASLTIRRDWLLLAWIPYHVLSTLSGPALLGFGALLWPDAPLTVDRATCTIVLLLPPAALLFHLVLLRSLGLPRWLLGAGYLLALGSLVLIATFLGGAVRIALAGNAVIGALIALLILLAVGLIRRPGAGLALFPVRILYLLQGLTLVWHMGFLLGWIDGVEANLYGAQLQGVFSAVLVALLLMLRVRGLRRSEAEAQQQLAQTRERAAAERAQREASEALLAMLAHELRTPLSVVSIALGRADNSQRSVQLARGAVHDINTLVTRCVDVDRVDGGAVHVALQAVALAPLVEDVVARSGCGERIAVTLQADVVQADPQLLHTVLRNLLDNALKYSPPDSTVRLHAAADEDRVWIDVDNAIGNAGLPDPEKIFHRYYRSPAAHATTGAGLGMYLVKRLVELQGGEVQWQPTADRASIRLCLPR